MRRAIIACVALSTALVALAYTLAFFSGVPPALAPVLLALGTAGVLASVLSLAVQRDGSLGILWLPVAVVLLVVGAGLVALVLLPAVDPADPTLILGLPPRAALLLYGVGFLPTLVVPVVYAVTFERLTLSDEDLERVRAVGRERKARTGEGEASR